jgi:hypothetical protein
MARQTIINTRLTVFPWLPDTTGFGSGPELDISVGQTLSLGDVPVKAAWAESLSRHTSNRRMADRMNVMLPARLTWKDQHGSDRFASVVTRDVSEFGVYVECPSPVSVSKFRLVQFQLERDARDVARLPDVLRQGRLLSAVYRVVPPTRSGGRQGLALRLMVDPRRHPHPGIEPLELVRASGVPTDGTWATA